MSSPDRHKEIVDIAAQQHNINKDESLCIRLSPELRDFIFKSSLQEDVCIEFDVDVYGECRITTSNRYVGRVDSTPGALFAKRRVLELTETCQRTHQESLPIF